MIDAEAVPSTDPTLAVAERNLAILAEVVQMALAVSRGYAAASLAAANAVEVLLADEYWQPETGRARALAGARDVADGFQKAIRSLRLTMKLETETAEIVRDLRAGIVADRKASPERGFEMKDVAGTQSDQKDAALDRRETNLDRLVEFDRPESLGHAPFRETVDQLCVDIGVAPDWQAWRIGRPPTFQPLAARPPGWSECRPPGAQAILDAMDAKDAEAALSP